MVEYKDMTVAELKKEKQRLWEVAVQAQKDAKKGETLVLGVGFVAGEFAGGWWN